MRSSHQAFERAMALAALSGLKIALGPAFLATSRRWPSRQSWVAAALGEMVLDKLGVFPPRYRLPLLIPHSLAGAWVARESLREDGEDDPWAAVAGAAVAAGVAVAAPIARIAINKVVGIPDALLGLGEDYLALSYGSQALDVPMDEITGAARQMFDDVRERAPPGPRIHGHGVLSRRVHVGNSIGRARLRPSRHAEGARPSLALPSFAPSLRPREAAMAASDVDSLRQHVVELLVGGHAHPDFEAAIAGLPADLRGSRPPGLPHTPWRLLEHMRIAQWDILRFSIDPDHVSPEFPSGYWPDGDGPPDPGDMGPQRPGLPGRPPGDEGPRRRSPDRSLRADPPWSGADDPPRGAPRGRSQLLPRRPDDRGPPAARSLESRLSLGRYRCRSRLRPAISTAYCPR